MHDTSTQSISKWKTIGAQRNQSSILSPTSRVVSKKFTPSKDRQISHSKLFNKNRSKIQSLDNISKEDLQDSISREGFKTKGLIKNGSVDGPLMRIYLPVEKFSQDQNEGKQGGIKNRIIGPKNFGKQKQLILLKEDYAKFKHKIITELQIQKKNMAKIVNQILQSVKQQLSALEQKYSKNARTIKPMSEQIMPSFKNFNLPTLSQNPSVTKIHDLSTINHIKTRHVQKNLTQTALIAQLTSIKSVENDLITQRFSKFYGAIQRLKSDLDGLHQISVIDQKHVLSPIESSLHQPLNKGSTDTSSLNNNFQHS